LNGKATWIAILGIMLTLAGAIYQGGRTVGQVRSEIDGLQDQMQQLHKDQKTLADVLVQQARGQSERKDLQRQINRLRDQIDQLQAGNAQQGPHQDVKGGSDG
jgi:chromosome segregation ATPase